MFFSRLCIPLINPIDLADSSQMRWVKCPRYRTARTQRSYLPMWMRNNLDLLRHLCLFPFLVGRAVIQQKLDLLISFRSVGSSQEHSILFLVANMFSVLRSLSRASKGDVLVTTPMILQSPQSSAPNSSSLKSRLGCWSFRRRFALTSTTQRRLLHLPGSPSPRIFRHSVANLRSSQINSY